MSIQMFLDIIPTITSIKNHVMTDEESAIVRVEFAGLNLTVVWTYSTGFSIPVFVNDKRILNHVEKQLKLLTTHKSITGLETL